MCGLRGGFGRLTLKRGEIRSQYYLKNQNLTGAAPPSNTLGSDGGGPSIAQRFDSYLERINDSILLENEHKSVICLGIIRP